MRKKRLLSAILLGVILCFVVSGMGYGEIKNKEYLLETKATKMEVQLLNARIDYIMHNPTSYLKVIFFYGVETGAILVFIYDNRDRFSYKQGIALLDTFKRELEVIYSFIDHIATNMNTDIIATFESRERIILGSFYQGEYHLWEE